jgi:RsiW-degrading membrane proteinase PrsW (M82 family)
MAALRYLLMLGTVSGLGLIGYLFATQGAPHKTDAVIVYSFLVGLVLNFVYLYRSRPTGIGKQSRLTRLVSLWLDVKERELNDRARKPPQSN